MGEYFSSLLGSSQELLNAIASEFSLFARDTSHDFDYCDVLAGKLETIFSIGSIRLKAHCLVSLLIMGVDHNRYFVENKFVRLASSNLDENVIERIKMDAAAEAINLDRYIQRLERSLGISRSLLHPSLTLQTSSAN